MLSGDRTKKVSQVHTGNEPDDHGGHVATRPPLRVHAAKPSGSDDDASKTENHCHDTQSSTCVQPACDSEFWVSELVASLACYFYLMCKILHVLP